MTTSYSQAALLSKCYDQADLSPTAAARAAKSSGLCSLATINYYKEAPNV